MKLDRTKTALKSLSSIEDDASESNEFVDASPAERAMMVWPLTLEIWNIYKPGYAEQRLQRNITALKRIGG